MNHCPECGLSRSHKLGCSRVRHLYTNTRGDNDPPPPQQPPPPGDVSSGDSDLSGDLPRLDPQHIRFARRSYLMGGLYVIAIPVAALVTFLLASFVVDFLDKPGGYAPNGAVAAGGGVLSGAIKVSTLAVIALMVGSLWGRAKAATQEDALGRFLSDLRLPVLYLRPFQADSQPGFMEQAPEIS